MYCGRDRCLRGKALPTPSAHTPLGGFSVSDAAKLDGAGRLSLRHVTQLGFLCREIK